MTTDKILYAGDTCTMGPAQYLAGVLTANELAFDYVASHEPIAPALKNNHSLYILSDYPVKNIQPADFEQMLMNIQAGAGLLMIGGWESFHGLAGEYNNSPLAKALPVEMASEDDRVNSWSPCLVEQLAEHPILGGLPLYEPPGIGGYNRIRAKQDSQTLLVARHFSVRRFGDHYQFTKGDSSPLLVVGCFGRGRTAAFASDVAPHWVGGLVDWGNRRLVAKAENADAIEVGNWYAQFFAQMVKWTMGK